VSLDLSSKALHELSSEQIESYLKSLWAMQLKLESVNKDDDFMSLGGQSVDMFRMLARLEEDFDLEIDFDDFFENPNLATLHALLVKLTTK